MQMPKGDKRKPTSYPPPFSVERPYGHFRQGACPTGISSGISHHHRYYNTNIRHLAPSPRPYPTGKYDTDISITPTDIKMKGRAELTKGSLIYLLVRTRYLVASFAPTKPIRCHPHSSASDVGTRRFASPPSDNKEWKGYPTHYHLITSDKVILPGETVSLVLSDEESIPLLKNCLDSKIGSLVVGVNLELSERNDNKEDWRMAQVASHCDIIGLTVADESSTAVATEENRVGHENVVIDLACTGRVRLVDLLDQYSDRSYRCEVESINETILDEQDLDKAQMLEKNIRALFKKASKMELEIRNRKERQNPSPIIASEPKDNDQPEGRNTPSIYLYNNFIRTKARVWRVITKDVQRQYITPYMKKRNAIPSDLSTQDKAELNESFCEEIQNLVATSWAAFLSLRDDTLEARYRLRALDWDNLIERLKLAQYALREKELFLQGQLMLMGPDEDELIMKDATVAAVNNDDELGVFQ